MKKPTLKPITRRLRILRADRHITQKDLADLTGIAYTRYMNIENGYRTPTRGELGKIARALKTTTRVLVDVVPTDPLAVAS